MTLKVYCDEVFNVATNALLRLTQISG